MSYVIPNASTNPYPKYHIGTLEHTACNITQSMPNVNFIEVDEPPQGYVPCRICFKKELGHSKKWKPIYPLTEEFEAYGQTFTNDSIPVSRIKRIRSTTTKMWPGGPDIVVSRIEPAGKFWMFPSIEEKDKTMEYIDNIIKSHK